MKSSTSTDLPKNIEAPEYIFGKRPTVSIGVDAARWDVFRFPFKGTIYVEYRSAFPYAWSLEGPMGVSEGRSELVRVNDACRELEEAAERLYMDSKYFEAYEPGPQS